MNQDQKDCRLIDMITLPEEDRSRQEWKTLANPLTAYIFTVDLDGRFIYAIKDIKTT